MFSSAVLTVIPIKLNNDFFLGPQNQILNITSVDNTPSSLLPVHRILYPFVFLNSARHERLRLRLSLITIRIIDIVECMSCLAYVLSSALRSDLFPTIIN